MTASPAVGDRSFMNSEWNQSSLLTRSKSDFRSHASLGVSGMRSLRFSGNSKDGTGSIRLGTPVNEPRQSSPKLPEQPLSPRPPRSGYMPPEVGRLEVKSILSPALLRQMEALYRKMDGNSDGQVTKAEAQAFFKRFGKLSAQAMFDEVDTSNDNVILPSEWRSFWEQVRQHGYREEDISAELQELIFGNAWVDFLDGRDVGVSQIQKR